MKNFNFITNIFFVIMGIIQISMLAYLWFAKGFLWEILICLIVAVILVTASVIGIVKGKE